MQPVLIAGQWRDAQSSGQFQSTNPATKEPLADVYPVSKWEDCDAALTAASQAYAELRKLPSEKIAQFLDRFAELLEANATELCDIANQETGLAISPRLKDGELPRTCNQLRQAAAAARDHSWRQAVKDEAAGIYSAYEGFGPVCVFGPNNFPFAFGSASGGDFAAAIAAGNPVIAKANSSHPATTRLLAEQAFIAAQEVGLPEATVQLIYRTSHSDGERLVADPRVAATGYTGSRGAGLKLKAAADAAGKQIYLELSSINPVVILPEALTERFDAIVDEFTGSCLMGVGQFCTNPGMILLLKGESSDKFVAAAAERFQQTPNGTLLSEAVAKSLSESLAALVESGAENLTPNSEDSACGFSSPNTLLRVSGEQFLTDPEAFQREAFGNASLFVIADDLAQATQILDSLEGNLTGCIYSDTTGADDEAYDAVAFAMRPKVGRLLNDKMPTGVAVSPAMNHGGPYPATGHPGFTAVGLPAAIHRFAALYCYDAVRPHRLPEWLK